MRISLLILGWCIALKSMSQVEKYVTVQYAMKSYEINALNDLEEKVQKKYTIHSVKASDEAQLIIGYNKYSKITDAEISYFGKTGLLLKKYRLKDFNDQVMQDGYTLFSDIRLKHIRADINEYPMMIEYSYTIKHKNTLGLQAWSPIEDFHCEVIHTEFRLKSKIPDLVSIKEVNFKGNRSSTEGFITYSMDSIAPLDQELFSNADELPKILISPSIVEMDGYQGKFKDWNQYGQWVNELIKDRDYLTPEHQSKIKKLIPANATIKTKIEILYNYLQNNTRYVGIQLGIGGFQPLPAEEVAKVGYGDCKGLSNYMRALLKCVDIDSYYTEIGNGEKQIRYIDFPSFYQTNHAILTVPYQGDTTYLECTSQNFPVGYIGNSNSDRYAMMITSSGGSLVRTPIYNQESNLSSSTIHMTLKSDGHGTASINSLYQGSFYETYSDFALKSNKEQTDEISELHHGMDYNIDSMNYKFVYSSYPIFQLNEYLTLRKYASVSGSRLFIPVNIIHRFEPPSSGNPRVMDIKIKSGYTKYDSLIIDIPSGFAIENLPKSIVMENVFGKLRTSVSILDDKIVLVNHFVLFKNEQPKTAFQDLMDILSKSYKTTQSKIVLKRVNP